MNNTSTTTRKRVQLAPAEMFGADHCYNNDATPCCSLGHIHTALGETVNSEKGVSQHLSEITGNPDAYATLVSAYAQLASELVGCSANAMLTECNDQYLNAEQRRACTVAALEALGFEVIDGPDTRPLD